MRISIKISGRWLRSKHFLNGEEFDRIMLLILNSNSFSVYEDGKLTFRDVVIEWENTNTPELDYTDISGLESYLIQLDGRIQTYSQESDPSGSWKTTSEQTKHAGDIWVRTSSPTGTYRWNGSKWVIINDSTLVSLAESKAQIFTSTPTVPYYKGDLWVAGSTGDIKHCVTSRTSGNYTASDWSVSSKYTDDTAANTAINTANSVKGRINHLYHIRHGHGSGFVPLRVGLVEDEE